MDNLWIFGDSFSRYFRFICPEYVSLLKYEPQIYVDILAYELDLNVYNFAKGGSDNYTIFHNWVDHIEDIKKDDIVIFGWSDVIRFRLANRTDEWTSMNNAFLEKEYGNIENFSRNSYKETIYNREHKLYHDELNNFIKLINLYSKNDIVIHWSWVFYNHPVNLSFQTLDLPNIIEETNGIIKNGHYGEGSQKELAKTILKLIGESGKYPNFSKKDQKLI